MSYRVSFCIPVYNQADSVCRVVKELLKIPNKDFQIVVSDNASTDGTIEKLMDISDSRLKIVVNKENVGAKRNWCCALEAGDGDYLYLVMGRDNLNPSRVDFLIRTLEIAKKGGIKLLEDCSFLCGSKMRVYTGLDAAKEFLKIGHPTGLIFERQAYHEIKKRKKYFMLPVTYPELWIKRDLLLRHNSAAYIPGRVYDGTHNIDLAKVKSTYEDTNIPHYHPAKVVEVYTYVLNMADKFDFTEKEYNDFFISTYEQIMWRVSAYWKERMESPKWAGHYSYEVRHVKKKELLWNILRAYKTINAYFSSRMNNELKIRLFLLTAGHLNKVMTNGNESYR